MDCTVPTLFKQYAELCEPGGVVFADFGLDLDFNNAVDGFVIVDTYQLQPHKREHYIGTPVLASEEPMSLEDAEA